jgi:hypothetical protein
MMVPSTTAAIFQPSPLFELADEDDIAPLDKPDLMFYGIDIQTDYRCRCGLPPRHLVAWEGANTARRFLGCGHLQVHVRKY